MFLGRRHQRLDDVDISLTAIGEQLSLQTVIAEPAEVDT